MDNDKNPRARVRDLMGDGYSYTSNTLRSRARACEDFYGAAIAREVDAAVDEPRGSCDTKTASPLTRRLTKLSCSQLA